MKPTIAAVLSRLDRMDADAERHRKEEAAWRVLEAYCQLLNGLAFLALSLGLVQVLAFGSSDESFAPKLAGLFGGALPILFGMLLLKQEVALKSYFAKNLDSLPGFQAFFEQSPLSVRALHDWAQAAPTDKDRRQIAIAASQLKRLIVLTFATVFLVLAMLVVLTAYLVTRVNG